MDNIEAHLKIILDMDMDKKELMIYYFKVFSNMEIENKGYLNIMMEIFIKDSFKIIFMMVKGY
jgi:hypothetical protein